MRVLRVDLVFQYSRSGHAVRGVLVCYPAQTHLRNTNSSEITVPLSPNIPLHSVRAYLFSLWFGFSAYDDSRLNPFCVCCQHVAMFARLQIRSHLNSFWDVRQKAERAWECFCSHLDPWLPTAISARETNLFQMHSGQTWPPGYTAGRFHYLKRSHGLGVRRRPMKGGERYPFWIDRKNAWSCQAQSRSSVDFERSS